MSKPKRKTPYDYVLEDAKAFFDELKRCREHIEMWHWTAEKLDPVMRDLRERVIAARQLGYVVSLSEENGQLKVHYQKKVPPTPWRFA